MSISVRVLGDLRRFIPAEITVLEGPDWSVGGVLDELVRRYPELGGAMFDAQGRLQHAIVLRVGDKPAVWPHDKDAPVEDGGELLLTRFHSGG